MFWQEATTDDCMLLAQAMLREASQLKMPTGQPLRIRIGIHSGPVTSGIVGNRMPRFNLFGGAWFEHVVWRAAVPTRGQVLLLFSVICSWSWDDGAGGSVRMQVSTAQCCYWRSCLSAASSECVHELTGTQPADRATRPPLQLGLIVAADAPCRCDRHNQHGGAHGEHVRASLHPRQRRHAGDDVLGGMEVARRHAGESTR
jgi:hypothetical protein